MNTTNINIGIAEDQHLFRRGIISLINSFEGMKVILEASNGQILLDELKKGLPLPDLLLVDLKMPDLDGIETTKQLRKLYPQIKVIILTIYDEDRFILHLLECGAHAYLFKDSEPEELEKAIHAVANDGFYFNESMLSAIQKSSKQKKKTPNMIEEQIEMSERERNILELICKEYTTDQIGEKLFISPRTVEGHRNRILEKTGCKNVAGLVVFAIKNNLINIKF